MKVVTARVTPPIAAAAVAAVVIVTVAQIQTSSRAKRERRTRKKIPVGITALRASGESRVRKRPPLTEAGHRVLTLDTSGLKRSPEIIDKQGQRGEGAGVEIAARRSRSSWREVKRERDTTAGTGRDRAAPSLAWTGVGAAREAGRTEVKTGVTVEMGRGTEVAQMEGEAEQQMGGAEAGRGGKIGGEVGAGRGERGAKTERKGSTDCLFMFPLTILSCYVVFMVIPQCPSVLLQILCSRSHFSPVEGSSGQKIS